MLAGVQGPDWQMIMTAAAQKSIRDDQDVVSSVRSQGRWSGEAQPREHLPLAVLDIDGPGCKPFGNRIATSTIAASPPASEASRAVGAALAETAAQTCDTGGRLRRRTGTGSHDPCEAMVGGLVHSGRVIFAAGAVMVAGSVSTFALSGRCRRSGWRSSSASRCCWTLLVRLMLVPILLRLTGWAAWWLPRWLDRLLPDVCFGHWRDPRRTV